MKTSSVLLFAIPVSACGIAYALARLVSADTASTPSEDQTVIITSGTKHAATPEMIAGTRALESRPAPTFQAGSADGKSYSLQDLSRQGPLALIFIKDGCPCSVAAEPYYNRLHDAYGSDVKFFGIIDGDREVAQKWARENQVEFPVLCDPDLKIVREYKAENSAYFALVAPGGKIEKYWPGYSVNMLKEANERLARISGREMKPVYVTDAPDELYSGCPY
ncbi:redoxin domain-containing protein [Singulisphaera sp. PoT]|uniref:peroxiredoxin family protein n=1 Tax=Singulisphaera sp. PoT TaxID=3411797 RepID=UPI003BF45DE4